VNHTLDKEPCLGQGNSQATRITQFTRITSGLAAQVKVRSAPLAERPREEGNSAVGPGQKAATPDAPSKSNTLFICRVASVLMERWGKSLGKAPHLDIFPVIPNEPPSDRKVVKPGRYGVLGARAGTMLGC